jgi:NADH-quinone oxidoreductase subunit G
VRVSTDRGSVTFPTEIIPDMPDGVIWLPTRSPGLAVSEHLAVSSGEVVRIEGGQ